MGRVLWQFERRLRHLGQNAIKYIYRRRRPEPSDFGAIRRVLLVRTDKIGDAVVSTPVIEALKCRFPDSEIDIVLGRRNFAAAPLLRHVNRVFFAKRTVIEMAALVRNLRARHYDIAIDMLPADSLTSAFHTVTSGARIKIGFEGSASPFYDVVVPHDPEDHQHHVPRLLRLLAPLNIVVPDERALPAVVLSPAALDAARRALAGQTGDGRKLVMINISGSSESKFWGVENFARLAKDIEALGAHVVLLSAPGDSGLLQDIVDRNGAASLPPRSDLMEFAALISFADLVISPDTSIVHISAALGRPVVTLTGPALVGAQWRPWAVPSRTVGCATSIPDTPYRGVLDAVQSLIAQLWPVQTGDEQQAGIATEYAAVAGRDSADKSIGPA